jgi:digeranylgeranylglycerophospholipid reductase
VALAEFEARVRRYDLIVVGGGFAGLTCAQAAAARGTNTVVLERKKQPGDACHTTGLLVKEVADAWDFPRRLVRKVHGVRLYAPNLRWLDFVSPGYYFLATDTPALMQWMTEQASETGAEIRLGASYTGAERSRTGIRISRHEVEGRFLVGCDGPRSAVARDFHLGCNRRFLTGIEGEFEGIGDLDDDRLHVFLDSDLAPGYIAWVVPGLYTTQVGSAARQPNPPRLGALVKKLSRVFNFDRARLVGRRGGLIPCGGPVRPFKRDGVMLLGDAAGMVSPLTAGGIHPAMQLGRAAGIALSDYLLESGPDPARLIRGLAPSFRFKRLLRLAFDFAPPNWTYDLALSSRVMRHLAQTIFFHHRGLFSLEAWRDILRPRLEPSRQ